MSSYWNRGSLGGTSSLSIMRHHAWKLNPPKLPSLFSLLSAPTLLLCHNGLFWISPCWFWMHHLFPLKPQLSTHHTFKAMPCTISALICLVMLSWWQYGGLFNAGLLLKKHCETDESRSSLAHFTFSPFPWFSSYDRGLEPGAYLEGAKAIELPARGLFPLLYEIPHIDNFRCLPFIFPLDSCDRRSAGSGPPKASHIAIERSLDMKSL